MNTLATPNEASGSAASPPRATAKAHKAVSAFSWLWTTIFVGPNIVLFSVFVLLPVISAFALSLFSWDLISDPRFVGFDNYLAIAGDARAVSALYKTGYLVLAGVIPTVLLSFGIAVLINTTFSGYRIIRTFYFLPIVISFVASAVLWRFIYDPRVGALNSLLGVFGVDGQNWLQSTFWAMPAISLVIVWMRLPLGIILYLAALQQINPQQIEAADIDGANARQKLRYIIWPSVKPVTFLVMILTLRGIIFDSFDIIQVMTGGGPLRSTDILIIYIYDVAFAQLRLGYGSALATLLFIIVGILALIFTPPRRAEQVKP